MKKHSLLHTFFLSLILLCMSFASCTQEPPHKPSQMVLEAWIDAEGYPMVIIHKSYMLASAPDSLRKLENVIEDQLIPFGRVAVSDGEQEVVLTGRLDTFYLPPYTYTTVDMEGVVGKSYTVTAKYEDSEAAATTTIPPVAHLDSLSVTTASQGVKSVHCYLTTDSTDDAWYLLFLRKKGTKQYQICPYGVFAGNDAENGKLDMVVFNPLSNEADLESMNYFFMAADSAVYQLKVARVDYQSYLYWKAYSDQIISRGILFVPIYSNIPGNVKGGIGNFTGMGSSVYRFTPSKDTVICF